MTEDRIPKYRRQRGANGDRAFVALDGVRYYPDACAPGLQVVALPLCRLRDDEAFRTRPLIRRTLNSDTVYLNRYEPLLADCLSW